MKSKNNTIERELYLELHKILNNNINEEEIKPIKKQDDVKLKQMLTDLDDISTLLSDKFTELKKNEKLLITVNSNEDEYNKIQAQNISDSIVSIRSTLKNLIDLYKYMTEYITKYGFKDINAKEIKENLTERTENIHKIENNKKSNTYFFIDSANDIEFTLEIKYSNNKFYKASLTYEVSAKNNTHIIKTMSIKNEEGLEKFIDYINEKGKNIRKII